MICHNCKHEWKYKGNSVYYATCPKCHYKVRVYTLESKVDGDEE